MSNKLVWSLYSAAAAAIAALVGGKAVSAGWRFVTGEEPPQPNDPHTPRAQAALWVLLTAIGVGLAQVFANRIAASRWTAFTGQDAPKTRQATVRF